MKITLMAAVVSTLVLAGCATEGEMYAKRDCKLAPATTMSSAGVTAPKAESTDKRLAEMQMATSDARRMNLQRYGMGNNMMEDVLYDCATQ